MWFNIGLCLSGWCRKMHLCVDYFVTDSPAHSPGNVWRGRISARIFWLFPKERRMLRKRDYQGRLSFHFFDRWMTDLATHRQKKVQAMSWKNLQMLEFCLFTWSWMGPINCAPNPYKREGEKNENLCKTVIFQWIQMKFRTQIRNQNRNNLKLFLEEI